MADLSVDTGVYEAIAAQMDKLRAKTEEQTRATQRAVEEEKKLAGFRDTNGRLRRANGRFMTDAEKRAFAASGGGAAIPGGGAGIGGAGIGGAMIPGGGNAGSGNGAGLQDTALILQQGGEMKQARLLRAIGRLASGHPSFRGMAQVAGQMGLEELAGVLPGVGQAWQIGSAIGRQIRAIIDRRQDAIDKGNQVSLQNFNLAHDSNIDAFQAAAMRRNATSVFATRSGFDSLINGGGEDQMGELVRKQFQTMIKARDPVVQRALGVDSHNMTEAERDAEIAKRLATHLDQQQVERRAKQVAEDKTSWFERGSIARSIADSISSLNPFSGPNDQDMREARAQARTEAEGGEVNRITTLRRNQKEAIEREKKKISEDDPSAAAVWKQRDEYFREMNEQKYRDMLDPNES